MRVHDSIPDYNVKLRRKPRHVDNAPEVLPGHFKLAWGSGEVAYTNNIDTQTNIQIYKLT